MRSSVLFLLLFVAPTWAQLATQGPQSVYEGQTVVAVDLIANPHRDVEPLRPLLEQKEGQPYSQANVEASITALEQKGGFPKVTVNVLPEPSGLRLNFLLEPAYYLGIVDFPGVVKDFSYTRLLQVVNLPDEDPYDRARIPVAETALQNFLQKNGYFQAKIQTKSEIDDAHQLVNVSFSVELGKQARIGTIDLQGPDSSESSRPLHAVRSLRARFSGGLLKSGKPYTPERMSAASVLIKRMLSQQRHLASSVEENPPQYHAETNRVDVSFKIEVGPVVIVRTTGARLSLFHFVSGRQLKKLIPIYSEGAIDSDLINEGQQNLVEYFQKKGYFDANVKTNFQRQPNQILLVYEIDRGRKHKVDRISFHGNRQISEDDLLAQVVVKRSHIWSHGAISQKLLKQSVTNLQALYRDRGYESVKVTQQITDHEPKIDVAFLIEEGPQTLIDNVQVTGNDNVPYDQLTVPKGFQLRSGAPFSGRRLSEDRNRISANYLNRGYLNAEVKTTVRRHPDDPHRVDVTYAVIEHQLVRVGDVLYLGQKQTRLSLIKKAAKVPPESPMSRGGLLEAESRLYDLNIFDWSSVGPRKPITDQTEESALVKVHEAKRNEITYGVGFEVSHRGGNIPSGTVAVPGLPAICSQPVYVRQSAWLCAI